MRLIDADQFGVISLQGKSEDFIDGAKFILEKIDEAPTLPNPCGKPCAFVRPHGEWVEHTWAEEFDGLLISNYECSYCHSWKREETDFCPNCGADMMEEGEAEC